MSNVTLHPMASADAGRRVFLEKEIVYLYHSHNIRGVVMLFYRVYFYHAEQ
jgi:hypothetical protein